MFATVRTERIIVVDNVPAPITSPFVSVRKQRLHRNIFQRRNFSSLQSLSVLGFQGIHSITASRLDYVPLVPSKDGQKKQAQTIARHIDMIAPVFSAMIAYDCFFKIQPFLFRHNAYDKKHYPPSHFKSPTQFHRLS
jgi:hypothetical protein